MSKKTLIIMIVAGLLLVGVSIGATLFLSGALGTHASTPAAPAANAHGEPAPAAAAAHGLGPLYHAIDPAIVVNIEDGALVRFLQIQPSLMAHDQAVIDNIDKCLPRISNDLILLYSAVKMDDIRTAEGRLRLQQQSLDTVNKAMVAETGRGGVEAVYFTKLVVQ